MLVITFKKTRLKPSAKAHHQLRVQFWCGWINLDLPRFAPCSPNTGSFPSGYPDVVSDCCKQEK